MLRWATPVKNMNRTATRDVELFGQQIHEGDRMLLLYPSANRDEAVFTDPYRFDVRRDPNPHVAFGAYGRHHCLGAPLARLELRVLFEELLARFADIDSSTPTRRRRCAAATSSSASSPCRSGSVPPEPTPPPIPPNQQADPDEHTLMELT